MDDVPSQSWCTNKRLFWFTFWALLGAVVLLQDQQKTYDLGAAYSVTNYTVYRGGGRVQNGQPHIESGETLAQKEIARVTQEHTFGTLALIAGIVGAVIILDRMSKGQKVLSDAFKR